MSLPRPWCPLHHFHLWGVCGSALSPTPAGPDTARQTNGFWCIVSWKWITVSVVALPDKFAESHWCTVIRVNGPATYRRGVSHREWVAYWLSSRPKHCRTVPFRPTSSLAVYQRCCLCSLYIVQMCDVEAIKQNRVFVAKCWRNIVTVHATMRGLNDTLGLQHDDTCLQLSSLYDGEAS